MTIRIHLAEDDLLLADGYASALRHAGYEVDVTHNGISTDKRLIQHSYHLLILDLGLPGLDGTDVLKRLRLRTSQIPVLVISAREALEERVKLLNLGADDYLVKPIALSELEARVRALIRRLQPEEENLILVGDLSIDTLGKRAWIKDKMLELTAREWSALTFLAARMNRIVGKDQIMQSLYNWDTEITENAIEKTISRLRSKLEPAGIVISTVRGLGYYLEKPSVAS